MGYTIDIYDKTGKKISTLKLNNEIFSEDKINYNLIHEYYLLQTSNARNPIAHTKTRGEVAGSGKKLYRQKGTGYARVGDRRSPIRIGGGVVFGPRNERNYTKSMNKKSRQLALSGILTLKAKDKNIIGLKDFEMKEPKTKEALNILTNIGLNKEKTLFVLNEKNINLIKSFRNLNNVKYLLADYLNPKDLLEYNKILFLESALNKINTK
ncbi:MAG TPA: 50S ribosomal protein L4 [Candidatus Absconditabacterales bacterium]|nr:50S ribosomal protein L4 [Candidatus Absconditabacterales bacterium]HOQ79080.1 50S ribosomal protein L4 [Candidatus Absconditabacterales bacterium]HPK27623.1 50S ribosomal protein L4 [Candidatus Absconditabacterales bacterium]